MSENKEPNPQCVMGDCVKYENIKVPKVNSLINISLNIDDSLNEVPDSLPSNSGSTQFLIRDGDQITTELSLDNHYTIPAVNNQMVKGENLEVGNLTFNKDDCICIVDTSGTKWYGKVYDLNTPKDLKQDSSVKENPKISLANRIHPNLDDKNNNEYQVITNPQLDKENVFNETAKFSSGTISKSNMDPTKNATNWYASSKYIHRYIPVRLMQSQYHGTQTTIHSLAAENKGTISAISPDNPTNISSVSSSSIDFDSIDNLDSPNNKTLQKHNSDAFMTNKQSATIDLLNHAQSTREIHNKKERNRRNRIKVSCDKLRILIPGLKLKTDKATLLEYTVQYLMYLRQAVGLPFDKEVVEHDRKD